MGGYGLRLFRCRVRVSHEQRRFFRNMNLPVNGIETVNYGLELRRYSEIIHGGRKNDHFRRNNAPARRFKIILENARAVHAA